MTPEQAKVIWKELQDELNISQDKINNQLRSARGYLPLLRFLENNCKKLNIFDVQFLDVKFGHYGKLIKTQLIIPENGRLYLETAYYPTAKKYFGKLRIAISNLTVFSNHYMERLIERKNITSVGELKDEIIEGLNSVDRSNLTQETGGLDITTEFILVYRDSVSFCDCEIDDNNECVAVRKTIITDNEFTKKQKEIVDYILDRIGSDACFLATSSIPNSTLEADNVIEGTKKGLQARLRLGYKKKC